MEKTMEMFLLGTFVLYLISSVAFVMGISGKNISEEEAKKRAHKWGQIGIWIAGAGVLFQLVFIIIRIILSGHFPTSNMFEFIAFLCFALVIAYIVVNALYRVYTLGAFVMPLAVILLGYASAFPTEIEPLIPALQSYWLYIHVTLAALGQGAFAVSFVAGLMYLLNRIGKSKEGKQPFYLEFVLLVVIMFISYSLSSAVFQSIDYQVKFEHVVEQETKVQVYEFPPIIGPYKGKLVDATQASFWSNPWMEAPSMIEGEKAASKLNSTLWGIVSGLMLYGLLRLFIRKPLRLLLHGWVKKLDHELLDEISYRAIAIGFPIFTLGALIFAMIWAHEAWGRFWNWDPKETWALITWLFYSAYLHLRLSRGWLGIKSSWLAVGGFVIIMINLIVINFVIAGLHSYA